MGKGDRRKRGKAKPPKQEFEVALASVPKRQPNGQHRQRADAPRDPRKTALDARCRIFGVSPTRQNRDALSGQHSGCELGLVMMANCERDELPPLWDVWQGFCSAMRTYRVRILGMSATAKGANIEMLPEQIETDQSLRVDHRDGDEKDRDAVNGYMRWHGYLGHLSADQSSLLHRAEQGDGRPLWQDGATPTGISTLGALRDLMGVKEKPG